jgi:adenylosuccinate synthase
MKLKGKTVANLSPYVDGIARVNSGENAGHTVYYNNKKFVERN